MRIIIFLILTTVTGLLAQPDTLWTKTYGEINQDFSNGSSTTVTAASSQDSLALVALYNSTDGDNWTNNTNWLTNEPISTWYGITVSDGRVTGINFWYMGNNLSGIIPSDIGNLTNLTWLDLYSNQLTGSIPSEIGNLTNLTHLILGSNQLTGSIPSEMGNLTNLGWLDLGSNQLTGSIPGEIGNLTNLTYLELSGNQLTGSIPSEIGNLTNLTELFLYSNQLTGTIPSVIGNLTNLTNLTNLSLNSNQLTGTIPSDIGNLTNLTYLRLSSNQLSGSIPGEIGNLTNLTNLSLSSNQLTGSIPSEISNLTNLTNLSLSSNQLTGSIPSEISNLTNLTYLILSTNQLTGSIPSEIGNLTNLTYLTLESNQLTGSIPSEIGNLTNLTWLILSTNQLTGLIPSEIGNLTNLKNLYLDSNQLTGLIPSEIGNLINLTYLTLESNQLTGSIPSEINNLTSLERLYIALNKFEDLPELSSLSSLRNLVIINNRFTFEDIEPNIGVANYFAYSPQDSVGVEQDTSVNQDSSITFSVIVGGEHNQYQWKKNNVSIPGVIASSYTISPVALSDAGSYTCDITNTVAPELTLHSRPINVTVIIDTTAPAVPQYLIAAAGYQQVTLRWNHNTEQDLHKYNIYRDISSPATTLIDSIVATSPPDTFYVDIGLTIGQIYYFRITAVDNGGNESGFSDEVNATPIPDLTPPTAPQNLTATQGNHQVTLRWSPNTESDLHKYNIYRDNSSPATTLIDSVVSYPPPDTFFVNNGLTNGQIYFYKITAVDSAGNESDFSNEISATPIELTTVDPTWPMFRHDLHHTGLSPLTGNMDSGRLLWSYAAGGGGVKSSPVLGDIDGDGKLEVVVGGPGYSKNINALNGENGSFLWSYTTGGGVESSPALGDIDGDGKLEVVVGSYDHKIYALNGEDGSFLWSYTTDSWIQSSPALGDIDGDGKLEVVIGSNDKKIYALNGEDGSFLWSYTTGYDVKSSPALGDIDGDGKLEVVVGSRDNKIYALNGEDGSFLWSRTTGQYVPSSPALGDIDGDGKLEVVVGSEDFEIYALNGENGSSLWKYRTGYHISSSPALGDIDGDGKLEVVIGSHDKKIYALNGENGTFLWSYTTGHLVSSSPALGDIDGDGKLEVVVGSRDEKIYALNGENGTFLLSYETGGNVHSSPALGDIDGDGKLEVVIGSDDNKIYALNGEFLELRSPNGGESWAGGTVQKITWLSKDYDIDHIRLIHSKDSGSTYPDTIDNNITSTDTSYAWTLPTINCTTCRIKVQILDSGNNVIVEDESNGNFTIEFYTTLSSPNGGETWAGGLTYPVTWSTVGQGFDSYRLLFSNDGGSNYQDTIATDISPDSTSFNWALPPINCTIGRVKVQILDAGNNVIAEDESNSNFSILTYPNITSPNGGEIFVGGSNFSIIWSVFGEGFGSYKLLFSSDGGSSYPDTIATGISPDSTSFNWTLPTINCTTCRIKVQILDSGNIVIAEDASDDNFTIQTYPTITSPNGGESWAGGSTHSITWTTVGQGFDSYRLLYSTDGGSSYLDTIATSISPDSTSYNWTLPPINYTTCRVKVQILDTGNNVISEDTSNDNFTIQTYPIIASPNGSEILVGGSTFTTTWYTVGQGFDSYRLLYSTDGGSSYLDTISIGISPDSTSWRWTLPPINCTTCRVKVQILDAGSNVIAEDASDGNFTIQFYTTLISPNGGEEWKGGSSHQIKWNTVGDGFSATGASKAGGKMKEVSSLAGTKSNNQWDITETDALLRFLNAINSYRLLYSIDGGSSYPDTIAANISRTDSTYDWIAPEITFNYVRIKIQVIGSDSQVLAEDWSDGNFEIDATPPAIITNLQVLDRTYNTINIRWTAPGDDSLSGGPATEYDIRYALSPIEEANWGAAIQCEDEPTPSSPFSDQTFTVTDILTDTPYYFAMKTRDEHYHWSGLSNLASDTTKPYPVLSSSQYPMFRYNIQHTGRSPYFGSLSNNIKWYFTADQPVSSAPIVGPDGIIYFTSENDILYAVYPEGTEKWNKPLNSTKSSPAIAINSTIYIGTGDGKLIAYRPYGSIKWQYRVSGSISSSPTIGADGAIYFGSSNDTLYSINADGSLKWKYKTGGDILSSPAISPDGIIYVGSSDQKLYAINPDGDLSWSMTTSGAIISSPAVDTSSGVTYAGSCNGKLYAVNPNGTIGWTYTTGDQITSSPAIDANGNILFGSFDGKVYSLSSNGDLLWFYQTEGIIESSPAIDARGSVYIGSNDGTLYCLNGSDGSLVWSSITGDKVTSSPAIAANSCIYVGSNDGRLYAYGPTAPVTLISPNGGENLDKNTVHNILWATTGSIENIELYYSLDSGDSYTLISDSEIDDGLYPWTIPDTTSSVCKVKVIAYDAGGDSDWDASDADFSISKEVNVDDAISSMPSIYSLTQNYPNPFNPITTIQYSLPEAGFVQLKIFDIRGQEVTILQEEERPPGTYEVQWNGMDDSGNPVSTGVYFCRLVSGDYSKTIKMVYLR